MVGEIGGSDYSSTVIVWDVDALACVSEFRDMSPGAPLGSIDV